MDYLLDDRLCVNDNYDQNTIFFAGNLTKSKFLGNLHEVKNVKFNLYGPCHGDLEKIKQQENVSYKGSFSPNELISSIEGGWGLVWDGDTIETCSGVVGEYLKFNNPHKVSMCIVSERPIIIWKESAMADYIKSNGLGVTIDSLLDIPDVLSGISEADYNKMLENVRKEKTLLSKGRKLGSILEKMEA